MLISHKLKHKTRKWSFRIGGSCIGFVCFRINSFNRGNIKRAGQKVYNRIKQSLNAFVLKGGTGNNGYDLEVCGSLSKNFANLVLRDLFALQVLMHQIV